MSTGFSCDVAVVGGGPAGSTAAFLLAGQGLRVCLFDKEVFPRAKLCAGLLTWKSIQLLEAIYGVSLEALKSKGVIEHSCREYRICFGRRELYHGRLQFPFHFIKRRTYDHHWLTRAEAAGARIHTGKAVTQIDPVSGVLKTNDGDRFRARLIIGADGVWSRVREALDHRSMIKRSWRKNLAFTIETRIDEKHQSMASQCASLYFGHVAWGYGWSFPGPGCRIVGMGALKHKNHQSLSNAFRDVLAATGVNVRIPLKWRSHPLPYGNFVDPPAKDRILLVGDACGLADPLLGEGIYYAHRSAQLAARAIIAQSMRPGPVAQCYRRTMQRKVIRELRWIRFYRDLLFCGGRRRRYRGLKLFMHLLPERLEAAVQGRRSYAKILVP